MLELDVVNTGVTDVVLCRARRNDFNRRRLLNLLIAENVDCKTECAAVVGWTRSEAFTDNTNTVVTVW